MPGEVSIKDRLGPMSTVAGHRAGGAESCLVQGRGCAAAGGSRSCGRHLWAELMRRVFGPDLLACPCGGQRKILAAITEARVIRSILALLRMPIEAPVASQESEPPELLEGM
jgi:hypothetical protein